MCACMCVCLHLLVSIVTLCIVQLAGVYGCVCVCVWLFMLACMIIPLFTLTVIQDSRVGVSCGVCMVGGGGVYACACAHA